MWSSRKHVTCFVSLILHLHWIGALHAAPPMSPMQRMQPIFPDSNELYSYVSPRTIADLKNEHARQAMMDVTDTINEVQRILSKDPSLPRLTRGEIEDLFEMVTREEYKRSLAAGDFDRAKHMRSLMLVLPYNTNSADESLEVGRSRRCVYIDFGLIYILTSAGSLHKTTSYENGEFGDEKTETATNRTAADDGRHVCSSFGHQQSSDCDHIQAEFRAECQIDVHGASDNIPSEIHYANYASTKSRAKQ